MSITSTANFLEKCRIPRFTSPSTLAGLGACRLGAEFKFSEAQRGLHLHRDAGDSLFDEASLYLNMLQLQLVFHHEATSLDWRLDSGGLHCIQHRPGPAQHSRPQPGGFSVFMQWLVEVGCCAECRTRLWRPLTAALLGVTTPTAATQQQLPQLPQLLYTAAPLLYNRLLSVQRRTGCG